MMLKNSSPDLKSKIFQIATCFKLFFSIIYKATEIPWNSRLDNPEILVEFIPMKQAYMETFGCQMNVADTDRMELLLFQSGYLRTPHVEDADLVLVNTCSIREKAEQKVFSLFGGLKPLKQSNPDLILGVAGCLAQQEQAVLMNRVPFLDFIIGPDAVESIQHIVQRVNQGEGPVVWTEFDSHQNYSIPEQPLIKIPVPAPL